jgi:hypothetical protein
MRCHADGIRSQRRARRRNDAQRFATNRTRPASALGTTDRSERVVLLRRTVLDALERARDQHDGRLSAAYESLEPHATREGLTRDDFYRAARRETVEKLSQSKLARLKAVLEQAGLVSGAAEPGAALVSAIEALSRKSLLPERLRRELPRTMLCLRRSYLVPGAVNVSHVEITFDDLVIHYRETRAGSLGAASQRSEIRGTVLHHEDVDGLLYVLGHNEFRTSFAVEETVSAHSNIVVLSVLRPCAPPSFAALEGIHVGVTPDNNPDCPDTPYAAVQVLIETSRTLSDAARAGLIQNHALADLLRTPAWNESERSLLRRTDATRRLATGLDSRYGLFMAAPPVPARAKRRATARKAGGA